MRHKMCRKAEMVALAFAILLVPALLATPSAQAQTYTALYNFHGGLAGKHPLGGVVRDQLGNLYGTTNDGGPRVLYGSVFKIDITGKQTVLHAFAGGEDGTHPFGLAIDAAGNLYGTTQFGGSLGFGTIFEVDSTGTKTMLYSFTSLGDGGYAADRLVLDQAGNLYGITYIGGDLNCATYGCGTVFKLDTNGTKTVLHSFAGGSDGKSPDIGLIRDEAGNLYGATQYGGDLTCIPDGCGIVFKVDPNGIETVLYRFTGGADGYSPNGSLALDSEGNLYGTTRYGGDLNCSANGCGTVFKLDTSATKTVIHSFAGGKFDGSTPYGGLVVDPAGNLYGVNAYGCYACGHGQGLSGQHSGTVFKIDSAGKETILHMFPAHIQQDHHLIIDAAGNLYGTTEGGGLYGKGVVFEITP